MFFIWHTYVHDTLIGRWHVIFRFKQKVRNQQEYAEQELVQRNTWISEITDLTDWLNAASVKIRAAPAVDSYVDGKAMQLLISEHKVELSFSFNSPDFLYTLVGIVDKFEHSLYSLKVLFRIYCYIHYCVMMIRLRFGLG